MRNVTFRQLQVFVEVAERGSLARVAEHLHLTPSAVSFQIKQIEAASGFALFERIGRAVAITNPGKLLLGYARPILQSLHDADQAMLALKGLRGGRISLGLVSTAKYIVPHMIARFREHYPGVAVSFRDGNRREILEMVTNSEVDLAIMGQPPEDVGLTAERFAAHPSVIIAPPTHPLRTRAQVPAKSLAADPFIMREEGSGTRALTEAFFRAAAIAPQIAMESSSNETIKQSVMAGMGLALISQHTIGLELALGLLLVLPVENFPLMREWFVAHRKTLPLLPIYLRLRDFLIDQGQKVIDDLGAQQAALAQGRAEAGRPKKRTRSPRA